MRFFDLNWEEHDGEIVGTGEIEDGTWDAEFENQKEIRAPRWSTQTTQF